MSATITTCSHSSFEFSVKSLKVSWYLKKAVGIENGSGRPGHVTASTITPKHMYEIAKIKQSDPYCQYMPLESIPKSIIETFNSMGIKVRKELD
ncbi:54S ribosomal protein l19 mitochondrial [Phtheirospermum japonicum]|uniref:Large ribosomal subunit protein uL11m n=1 Tax=Phtheirospermum japonicum TaxID=374723 RepID=A0A830C8J8_9LAMI|nr:54S ribosomal protein l19 mitochondrial [Phtheirospermum japonicum]